MNDQQLADKVVALGVLRDCNNYAAGYYALPGEGAMDPFKGSNLWRVAGALMEKCAEQDPDGLELYVEKDRNFVLQVWQGAAGTRVPINDSLPRAVIEACVEALEGDDDSN